MKNLSRVSCIALIGSAVLLFTACSTTTTEHRTALKDIHKTFVGFEGAFKRHIAESVDAAAAESSVKDESAQLSENIIGLSTRDEVLHNSNFTAGSSGIYAATVAEGKIVLNVLITGLGRTYDWRGEHSEVAYVCIVATATPPNRESISTSETECPGYLPQATLGPEKKFHVPLQDIIRNENEK